LAQFEPSLQLYTRNFAENSEKIFKTSQALRQNVIGGNADGAPVVLNKPLLMQTLLDINIMFLPAIK
jgi:hypothetical protein